MEQVEQQAAEQIADAAQDTSGANPDAKVVEMPAPAQEVEAPKPVALPACPYCGDDPAKLSVMPQAFPGGLIGTIVFCGNPDCRKIHAVQILGQVQKTQGGIVLPPGVKP